MFELVFPGFRFVMLFGDTAMVRKKCVIIGLVMFAACAGIAHGQDSQKVPISFLPPPLENATYSLGIYEAKSGKLVRRLQEIAPESAFTVGLNGLVTNWDGKNDEGKAVPPGRYAARGYAIGSLKVEGVGIRGNEWAANDEDLRITHIESVALISKDGGLGVLADMPNGDLELLRFSGKDFSLLWRQHVGPLPRDRAWEVMIVDGNLDVFDEWMARISGVMPKPYVACKLETGEIVENHPPAAKQFISSPVNTPTEATPVTTRHHVMSTWAGQDGTHWEVSDFGIMQMARNGDVLRRLEITPDNPLPQVVSASQENDRLCLLEEKAGWQRVRELVWVDKKTENSKVVSTWQTVFERSIRPSDGPVVTEGVHAVTIPLNENPLTSGKLQNAKFSGRKDDKGSYLTDAEGLRLRRISENPNLREVILQKGKTVNRLAFYQSDGAAWDEFSIEGVKNMMAFDAGEFEMTADGEKAHPEKAVEPPDL